MREEWRGNRGEEGVYIDKDVGESGRGSLDVLREELVNKDPEETPDARLETADETEEADRDADGKTASEKDNDEQEGGGE